MNMQGRAALTKAYAMIAEAKVTIEAIGEGEQEKFDNMPEGLQYTDRGQRMEEVAAELAELASTLDDALQTLTDAQDR